MKFKFPFEHVIKYDTKEVWVKCDSAITTIGITSLVKKYYPGYVGRVATQDHLDKLRNQFEN